MVDESLEFYFELLVLHSFHDIKCCFKCCGSEMIQFRERYISRFEWERNMSWFRKFSLGKIDTDILELYYEIELLVIAIDEVVSPYVLRVSSLASYGDVMSMCVVADALFFRVEGMRSVTHCVRIRRSITFGRLLNVLPKELRVELKRSSKYWNV